MISRKSAPAAGGEFDTILVALELSKASWLVALATPLSERVSRYSVAGGDAERLLTLVGEARRRVMAAGSGRPVQIVVCYEAGYDGFWLQRRLAAEGIETHVLEPASLPVDRRRRRVKTDRLDAEAMLRVLAAWLRGERQVCRMVRPPSPAEEDARRLHRERGRLIRERVAHVNRIKGLLHGQGVRGVNPLAPDFAAQLGGLRTGDGRPLPPALLAELGREVERLRLVCEQAAAVEPTPRAADLDPATAAKIDRLQQLKGIGPVGARVLATEVFYRRFPNRRAVGSYLGLTPSPWQSGAEDREQGISKAGNPRARAMAIELAWLWVRHQPATGLSRWFTDRVGGQRGRTRRIAIVAVARKLMVALWRYLETGLVPDGAVVRAA
jgi:transposase